MPFPSEEMVDITHLVDVSRGLATEPSAESPTEKEAKIIEDVLSHHQEIYCLVNMIRHTHRKKWKDSKHYSIQVNWICKILGVSSCSSTYKLSDMEKTLEFFESQLIIFLTGI